MYHVPYLIWSCPINFYGKLLEITGNLWDFSKSRQNLRKLSIYQFYKCIRVLKANYLSLGMYYHPMNYEEYLRNDHL